MEFKKEIAEKINTLLQNSINAVEGYKKAQDKVTDPELKIFFNNRVKTRSKFAEELRTEILRYGQIPQDDTTFKADMHRMWIDIQAFFSSNDREVILEECIRGDEKALEDYHELTMERNLPPTLDEIFARHYKEILSSLNKDRMYLNQLEEA